MDYEGFIYFECICCWSESWSNVWASQAQSVICCTNTNVFYPKSNQRNVTPADCRRSYLLLNAGRRRAFQHHSLTPSVCSYRRSRCDQESKSNASFIYLPPASSSFLLFHPSDGLMYQTWTDVLINHINRTQSPDKDKTQPLINLHFLNKGKSQSSPKMSF